MRLQGHADMVILGISGKRGVGKTLMASHLVRTCGFIKMWFAEELKKLACQFFPFSGEDLASPKLKEKKWRTYDWSPREFLIHLGEFARFHDENFWTKKTLDKCTQKDAYYVFDDVRYDNEYNIIKNMGGKIIRINRYTEQNPYGEDLDTPSETQLDKHKFDYVIEKCRNTSPKMLTDHTTSILELYNGEDE